MAVTRLQLLGYLCIQLSHAHEIELDENARDVAKMLKQLGISPDFIVTKGPSVFKQDGDMLQLNCYSLP